MDHGVIAQNVIISGFQYLLTLVAQLVADELLYLGIVKIALAGALFGIEPHNLISTLQMASGIDGRNHRRPLPGL